jgi:hypothetical protein
MRKSKSARDVIRMQAERQKKERETIEAGAPMVGIFWVIEGEFIPYSTPLAKAEDWGEYKNDPRGHYQVWESLRRASPKLRDLEYDHYPRGRVVFNREEKRFTVFLKASLLTSSATAVILREFNLPADRTDFKTDIHYG